MCYQVYTQICDIVYEVLYKCRVVICMMSLYRRCVISYIRRYIIQRMKSFHKYRVVIRVMSLHRTCVINYILRYLTQTQCMQLCIKCSMYTESPYTRCVVKYTRRCSIQFTKCFILSELEAILAMQRKMENRNGRRKMSHKVVLRGPGVWEVVADERLDRCVCVCVCAVFLYVCMRICICEYIYSCVCVCVCAYIYM